MDARTGDSATPGIGDITGANSGVASGSIGSIDPDAARDNGITGDDFTAAIAEPITAKTDTGTRKRGRHPAGCSCEKCTAKQSRQGKEPPLNVSGIERILFSAHAMLAGICGIPEIAIEQDEAKQISKALAGVSEHYNVSLDPKVQAHIELALVLGNVYGPRVVAYGMRKSMQRHAQSPAPKPQAAAPTHAANPANNNAGDIFATFDPMNNRVIQS